MIITKQSGNLTIEVDSYGAELHSIKLDGHEYLWQSKEPWKRYAPILFPFICSPKNQTYIAKDATYIMPGNHGFARDSEFRLLHQDRTSASFLLSSNKETMAVYPYGFDFIVKYVLADGKIIVRHIVKNKSPYPMYFYLGGHPAFNCPLEEGLSFDDYYIEFAENETIVQAINDSERTILENEKKMPLTRKLFDYDVVMKDAPTSKEIRLKTDKATRFVSVEYPMSNCIAIWSPTADDHAKFVCLEPWTSVPIYADDAYEDLSDKPHAIMLLANRTYEYEYSIVVG